MLSRVVKARGAAGALVALRALGALWRRPPGAPAVAHAALDLHAALLRAAHALLPALAPKHAHHALPLIEAVGTTLVIFAECAHIEY